MAVSPSSKAARELAVLHAEIRGCTRCVEAGYLPFAQPTLEGEASDRIMVIGQAPGEVELTTRRPFTGRAGAELRRWLEEAGVAKPPYRTSMTKCFPGKARTGSGDRRPSPPELRLCASWLEQELALVRPAIVLLVGGLSIERFWGKVPLDQAIGRMRRDGDRLLIPLPHPSGASRWLNDDRHRLLLRRALGILRREVKRVGQGIDTQHGTPAESRSARGAAKSS